jgi:phosphohistidine phosphatase
VHHARVAKSLYLLRHLKSSWDEPGLPDHERPLASRGRRAGKKLARHLRKAHVAPELVLCSPSVRTRETLEAIRPALGKPDVRFPSELYAASDETLLRAVRSVEWKRSSVLVIAHNPGLGELALALAGSGDERLRERLAEKFPTGAFATLEFGGVWSELEPAACALVGYVVPREL